MYPTFICINAWNLLWNSTRTIMLCILYPFLHVFQTPIYWTSIISSCIGLLYVELLILIYKQHPPPSKKRIHYQTQTKPPYMFIKQHSLLLSQYFYIFSGVALNQEFFGWMKKMENNFHGFTTSMYNIGTNETRLVNMESTASVTTNISHRVRLLSKQMYQ